MRGNFERSDELVREMLNNETNDVAMNYYRVVIDWWNRNLVFDAEAQEKMKSNALWTHFKRDLGDDLREMDYASFKEVLCSFLGEEKVVRGKGKTGALEISGVAWKEKTREGEVET
jgi:hypothetical protein